MTERRTMSFYYSLNSSTIKTTFLETVGVAAATGYGTIDPARLVCSGRNQRTGMFQTGMFQKRAHRAHILTVSSLERFTQPLAETGYDGWISLERFREDLRSQGPLEVARRGLEAMKRICEPG